MHDSWKNDPRLKTMDQKKLTLLMSFAESLEQTPNEHKMAILLSLQKRAAEEYLTFSPEETELLFTILTKDMPPGERQKLQMIRNLVGMPGKYRPNKIGRRYRVWQTAQTPLWLLRCIFCIINHMPSISSSSPAIRIRVSSSID